MNEIKQVVNTNYGEVGDITNLTTTDKSSIVNAVNEVNSKNMLSVYLSANTDVNNNGKVPFDLSTSIGNKLTFNSTNNEIIVGAGVSKIKVELNLGVRYTGTTGKVYGMTLQVNGSDPSTPSQMVEARCQKSISEPISISSGAKLIDVSPNDKLSCKIIAGATCPCTPATFFSVEVIE